MALTGCSKSPTEPVEHFRVVIPGNLSAGARLSEDGLRWLQERGTRTIPNLERELFETTVFVHFDHGIDRTGIVIAAYRVKARGWPAELAYREMIHSGFQATTYFWCESAG